MDIQVDYKYRAAIAADGANGLHKMAALVTTRKLSSMQTSGVLN
jgi:hypothetical protein